MADDDTRRAFKRIDRFHEEIISRLSHSSAEAHSLRDRIQALHDRIVAPRFDYLERNGALVPAATLADVREAVAGFGDLMIATKARIDERTSRNGNPLLIDRDRQLLARLRAENEYAVQELAEIEALAAVAA